MIVTTKAPPTTAVEPRIVLYNVDWETYCLLRENEANIHTRMTYDRGVLEIMTTSHGHERIAELLCRFVNDFTVERDIEVSSAGHMTVSRKDLEKGLEPDKCWYVQNVGALEGRDDLDFRVDPPPDLVIEVEVTSGIVSKIPIYAALGIPEVWHWRREAIQVLRLDGSEYRKVDGSTALPGFPFAAVLELLAERQALGETQMIKKFRELVRRLSP